MYTYLMLGDYEKALAANDPERHVVGFESLAFELMGRKAEAIDVMNRRIANAPDTSAHRFMVWIRDGVLKGDRTAEAPSREWFLAFPDCEGHFYHAQALVRFGRSDWAIELLERAAEKGFFAYRAFVNAPWLDPLRDDDRFRALLRRVEARSRDAAEAFARHPAGRILTVGGRQ